MDGSEGSENYSSLSGGSIEQGQQSHHQHQQYLGDVTQGLPDFEDLDTKGTPIPGNHFQTNNLPLYITI